MSFFINNNNPNKPGPICGNATSGLCEKALIETTKVFDACLSQTTETGVVLALSDYDPASPTTPLTFISAEADPNNPATISNVVITRLADRPNFANVTGSVTIPIVVTYRDANGVLGTATSSVTYPISPVLFVPHPSLHPVRVEVPAQFRSKIRTYTGTNQFTVTGCLQIIIKVVADVLLLIPSYGYPTLPPCQIEEVNVCPGVFDTPLFPGTIRPGQNG